MANASSLFDHPPAEVQRFLDAKGVKPAFDWRDLNFDEHAHAFSIAKSAGYDILDDVKGALSRAIDARQDFSDFARELEPKLKAKGWWGKSLETDPLTGEAKVARLGSPARLKLIYWANVNTAYAAGEWERIQRTKRVLPYLLYLHTTSAEPRVQHLAWVGTLLPIDHPWWRRHFPPNGWECKCRTRQIDDAEAERLGYDSESAAEPVDFGTRKYVNQRTGKVEEVPVGIDPGWANNPGLTRQRAASDLLTGRVEAMASAAREAAIADLADSWLMKRISSRTIPFDPQSRLPSMISRGEISVPFAALSDGAREAAAVAARVVRLSVADAHSIARPPEAYAIVQNLIDLGSVTKGDAGRIVVAGEAAGETWRATLRPEADGSALYLEALDQVEN